MREEAKKLMHAIADVIELDPTRYDQSDWVKVDGANVPDVEEKLKVVVEHGCGSAFCIAGWAAVLEYDRLDDQQKRVQLLVDIEESGFAAVAEDLLDLSFYEGDDLFASRWKPKPGMTVPEALRRIAEGGSVESVTDFSMGMEDL